MTRTDLKFCPFCGSAAIVWMQAGHAHYLECSHCGGRIRPHIDKAEAIEAWNRRAEPERKKGEWIEYPDCLGYDSAYSDDHIVCSECEHVFSICDNCTEEFDFCPHCGADMRGE